MFSFFRNKKFLYWLMALALIFIIHFSGIVRPVENFFVSLINPVSNYFHDFAFKLKKQNLPGSREDLQAQLDILQKQRAKDTVDEVKLKLLLEENAKLREQLNFLNNNNYRYLSANIIARKNIFFGSEQIQDLIIDRGSDDGVIPGLALVNEEGVIIAKVLESKAKSSRACLTVSPDCRVAVAIMNKNKTIGLSDGDLGLTIKLDYIPQSEEIEIGDIVISSGLGDNIPRGLVLGRVDQVNKQSNEIWQDVNIESLASIYDLTVVSVILP